MSLHVYRLNKKNVWFVFFLNFWVGLIVTVVHNDEYNSPLKVPGLERLGLILLPIPDGKFFISNSYRNQTHLHFYQLEEKSVVL